MDVDGVLILELFKSIHSQRHPSFDASSMRLVRRAFANLRLQRIPEVWADFELARRAVQRLGIESRVCLRTVLLHSTTPFN